MKIKEKQPEYRDEDELTFFKAQKSAHLLHSIVLREFDFQEGLCQKKSRPLEISFRFLKLALG